MRCSYIATALVALAGVGQSAVLQKRDLLQDLRDQALQALKEAESKNPNANKTKCSISNAEIRQDW
jgi:tyrosinase